MNETTPTTVTPSLPPSADNPYPNTPPMPYQPEPKYNLFSLISFISAFFISVLAIVMGHMALSEIKKTGERGRGLALAGLILGYLGTLTGVGFIAVMIVAAAASPTSEFSVFDSKAQSGFTQTTPDELEPQATDLPTAETTVSTQFCDVLATMNAGVSNGAAAEQTPEELLGSYKRLGEVASPNQAVYAEFHDFVAGSKATTPSSAETSAIMDKVQVASVSDAHACAELGGGK